MWRVAFLLALAPVNSIYLNNPNECVAISCKVYNQLSNSVKINVVESVTSSLKNSRIIAPVKLLNKVPSTEYNVSVNHIQEFLQPIDRTMQVSFTSTLGLDLNEPCDIALQMNFASVSYRSCKCDTTATQSSTVKNAVWKECSEKLNLKFLDQDFLCVFSAIWKSRGNFGFCYNSVSR